MDDPYVRRKLVAGILVIIFFLILLIGEAMQDRKIRFCLGVIVCSLVLLVTALSAAFAHDHEHPELDEWYMSLHAKGGAWCCDGKDAVTVDEWTTKDGHYSARVEGEWIEIPDDAVVEGPNRAIQAKVWPKHIDGHPQVRCFIPGAMG